MNDSRTLLETALPYHHSLRKERILLLFLLGFTDPLYLPIDQYEYIPCNAFVAFLSEILIKSFSRRLLLSSGLMFSHFFLSLFETFQNPSPATHIPRIHTSSSSPVYLPACLPAWAQRATPIQIASNPPLSPLSPFPPFVFMKSATILEKKGEKKMFSVPYTHEFPLCLKKRQPSTKKRRIDQVRGIKPTKKRGWGWYDNKSFFSGLM